MNRNQELTSKESYICIKRNGEKVQGEGWLLKEHSLDIFVNGNFLLNTVCTKEYLQELVCGRLLTEGLIQNWEDIINLEISEDKSQVHVQMNHKKNNNYQSLQPIFYSDEWIFAMANKMAEGMPLHEETWATHSCFLYQKGKLVFSCEDIGRHNAMDKVSGYGLIRENNIDLKNCAVYSSGRVPVDMVQKVIRAGIPILVSKGVPSEAAVQLAKECGLTLICSARKDQMKIYTDFRKHGMDALILAGGKSSRMGGSHKGNLMYREETFAQHLVNEVRKVADNVWISYGKDIHEEYTGCEIVTDEFAECGPIGGIHAGLKSVGSEQMIVVACDMPLMQATFFEEMQTYLTDGVDGVVPVVDERIHPLAAIYKKRILPVVEEQILGGDYRLRDVLDKLNIRYVDVSENDKLVNMLRNINTAGDYEKLILPV